MENEKKTYGFILIDKPCGPTSHAIVNQLRRITSIKRIGHAGTLDPFASGLLIMAIGREATKKISQFVKLDKEYLAEVYLGIETDTYDREGRILKEPEQKPISIRDIGLVIKEFKGKQLQIPPMFSAKKVAGKKLYELARKNIEIERVAREIEIFDIEIMNYAWPILSLRVHCTSGTYIRSLAFDLGRKLKCGAHLQELRRTKIGGFAVEQAVKQEALSENNWQRYLFGL